METLHEIFMKELRQLYVAETKLVDALPQMADAATSQRLKDGFNEHLEQTKEHVTRLEKAFSVLNEEALEQENLVINTLLEEGEEIISGKWDMHVKDAALIAAAQKVEHYEIAAYGTVMSWAKTMQHNEVLDILMPTLEEEKEADEKLTKLAKGNILKTGINEKAVS